MYYAREPEPGPAIPEERPDETEVKATKGKNTATNF